MDGELVHDNLFISSPVMQVQLKDFRQLQVHAYTYKNIF